MYGAARRPEPTSLHTQQDVVALVVLLRRVALVVLLRREVARHLVPKRLLTISLTISLLALGGDLVAKLSCRPPAAIKQGGAVVSSSLAQTYATNSGMTASTFSTATNSVVNPFAS